MTEAVWEWADSPFWVEYAPEVARQLEAAHAAGCGTVNIEVHPGAGPLHQVRFCKQDAMKLDRNSHKTEILRRRSGINGNAATWRRWVSATNQWVSYDSATSALIDSHWQRSEQTKTQNQPMGIASAELVVLGSPCSITFASEGFQINRSTGFFRGIRRRCGPNAFASVPDDTPGATLTYIPEECFVMPDVSKIKPDEECSICCELLRIGGTAGEEGRETERDTLVQLSQCVHTFHQDCIKQWFLQKPSCPECVRNYGKIVGTQPVHGATMSIREVRAGNGLELAGFPGIDVIEIVYRFTAGIQGKEHPHEGMPYTGTTRVAYLPKISQGEEVLALLKTAWNRRLIFRVGTSISTGIDNTVVWSGIHHKTSTHGGPQSFGYPDETYFARVKCELADLGVI